MRTRAVLRWRPNIARPDLGTPNRQKDGTRGTSFRVFRLFCTLRRFDLAWNSVRFGEACELNLTHFTNRVG
jgi:hypothetical protein